MKLCLLSCNNQYASKRHFTQKFAEACQRNGIDTHILSWTNGPLPEELIGKITELAPDLTASFHQLPEQSDGRYFWDRLQLYHWTILLDPVFYDLELMRSPFSIISCVDRNDCELLNTYHFDNTFFFPHAVEKELLLPPTQDRPIDVLMLGTCYDPHNLALHWKKNYQKKIVTTLHDAAEIVLSDTKTTFVRALLQSLTANNINIKEIEFDRLANYVDSYSRGIDRLNLIQSIKDAHIHVYGDKCWREEQPINGWEYYLSSQSNVTIHPAVNFNEALQLMQKSKICLNSMPFFKNGTHERIFTSLACGSTPLSSDNPYLREIFTDNESILFYQSNNLNTVNDIINNTLQNNEKRCSITSIGQDIVQKNHTWDSRTLIARELRPPAPPTKGASSSGLLV